MKHVQLKLNKVPSIFKFMFALKTSIKIKTTIFAKLLSHYSGLYLPSRGIEGSMKTWCKCYSLNNGVRLSPIFYIKSCPKFFIFFASAQISFIYLNYIVSKCTIYCGSADVLSGRHFVRTSLDVLLGRRFVRTDLVSNVA